MGGHLLTGGAVGFVRKACKHFGFARALAGWGGRWRWTLAWGALAWPGILEHQEQPDECDQRQLIEKWVWNHGDAPSQQCEMGALYRVLTTLGLSASYGYTTIMVSILIKPMPQGVLAEQNHPRQGIVNLTQKITRLCSKERTIESFGLSQAPVFSLSLPPQLSSKGRRLGAIFH
jgi:hypothetical protein